MSNSGFVQLGDFFPERQLNCEVLGCNNLCMEKGAESIEISGLPKLPEHLCEDCAKRFNELKPIDLPCSTPGCTKTWSCDILRLREMELKKQDVDQARGICDDCRKKLAAFKDVQAPCKLSECKNTWTWGAKDQFLANASEPPQRYCKACESELHKLRDRQIQCQYQGCENTWTWSALEQLRYKRLGKNIAVPPRQACMDCIDAMAKMQDVQVKCRVRTCSRTWTFTVEAQLQYKLIHGDDSPPPTKMCDECYAFYKTAEDRLLRCQTRGCHGRWLYSKKRQLEDFAAGTQEEPRNFCKRCRREMDRLDDMQIECCIPGCANTVNYTKREQFLNHNRNGGKRRKPEKRCTECEAFLAATATKKLACEECGCEMAWSSYEQLLHQKSSFAKPRLCPDCNLKRMAPAASATEKNMVSKPEVFRVSIPAKGAWLRDKAIADWPTGITHNKIEKLQSAHTRLVIVANDCLSKNHTETDNADWPALLDDAVTAAIARDEGLIVAAVNAGILDTTSRQIITRFQRDIAPFQPQAVVFTFALADAFVPFRHDYGNDSFKPKLSQDESEQAAQELCRLCEKIDAHPVLLIPNPIFPEWKSEKSNAPSDGLRQWALKQDAEFRQRVAALNHAFRAAGNATILDFRPRFEVNGVRSARKWMNDWQTPNATGHQNIANWLAAELPHSYLT
jgi:lysophospholipase L1-like esterase